MEKSIIIDCDGGIDDALALILLLHAHKNKKIKVVAVTCVNGNTTVENVVRNVCRTMETCGITDVPVYKGAYSPILSTDNAEIASMEQYYGEDGFSDTFKRDPDMSPVRSNHAVYAIHRFTLEYPGEISFVCLGPLTNIALAIRLYPEFVGNAKEFFVMGGNSTGQGNVTAQAEFNFYTDPESAHIVLNFIYKPIWLMPWECCLKSRITHEWRKNVLGKINIPCVRMMNRIEDNKQLQGKKQLNYYVTSDAFLAAIVLRPDMAKNVVKWHADVELIGKRTRGQVVLDHLQENKPNVHLIEDFDSEIFKKLVIVLMELAEDDNLRISTKY